MPEFFSQLQWQQPFWLFLALQPVIFYLLKTLLSKSRLSQYAEIQLQPWVVIGDKTHNTRQGLFKNVCYLLAWLFLGLALAGPRIPDPQVPQDRNTGGNVLLLLDISRSMQATDIQPNRLQRAIREIYEFTRIAHKQNMAVMLFSARSHLYVPLTRDMNAIRFYLKDIRKIQLPVRGSNILAAIQHAQAVLQDKKNSSIILLTDGDEDPGTLNLEDFRFTHSVNIIGVGTIEGEAIPDREGSWLQYQGETVITHLNEDSLKKIAQRSGGIYTRVRDDDNDWLAIYSNLRFKQNTDASSKEKDISWIQYYTLFLLPSILLFSLALLPFSLKLSKTLSPGAFLLFIIISPHQADASGLFQSTEELAFTAFKNKNFQRAAFLYRNTPGYNGLLGLGDSLYRLGHYQAASNAYQQAILKAVNTKQRLQAIYNLANSFYHRGQFQKAIATYRDVLRYQPEHEASRYNLAVTKKLQQALLQRLKQQRQFFSTRSGNGPRSAEIEPGTGIGNNSSISLSDNTTRDKIPLPEITGLNKAMVEKLLSRGLKNIQLANTDQDDTKDLTQNYSNTSDTELNSPEEQHILWQRLFEIEQGFPAPVREPHSLPGVKPW